MSVSRNSAIVYQGASSFLIDAPIMAVVTGLTRQSQNPKTGPMAHLWILRSDMSPLDAVATRGDYAICSDCGLRGNGTKRACYVSLKNAPLSIYRAFKRGMYPTLDPSSVNATLRAKHLGIRLGAYGEPTALPLSVLQDLTEGIRFTGYTHQWASRPAYRSLLMASVDTAETAAKATSLGWRTFRTRTIDEPLRPTELVCPASDEAGKRTTCDRCNLCNGIRSGDRRKSIAIAAHGNGRVHFLEFRR